MVWLRNLETARFGELSETVQGMKLKGRHRAFGHHSSALPAPLRSTSWNYFSAIEILRSTLNVKSIYSWKQIEEADED